jgi:ATP-dependent Clp protease adapter protein ClpS
LASVQTIKPRGGYFKVGVIRGVPVFVRWSFPVGGVLVASMGRVDPRQWAYYSVAYTLLVLIHEGGHLLAAVSLRLRVFSLEISALGGLCRLERPHHVWQSALVWSAGLIAQLVTLVLTFAYINAFGMPSDGFGRPIIATFTFVNFILFVGNLIPHRSVRSGSLSDGTVLWRLFLHVFRGRPHPHPPIAALPPEQAPVFPPETRLFEKPGFRPPGFIHGVEILNDPTTPMEFVVSALSSHFAFTRDEAIEKMLYIHNNGGILIPINDAREARRIADSISSDARTSGHAFTCRYAGT